MSRFRSSHHSAARLFASFGIEGHKSAKADLEGRLGGPTWRADLEGRLGRPTWDCDWYPPRIKSGARSRRENAISPMAVAAILPRDCLGESGIIRCGWVGATAGVNKARKIRWLTCRRHLPSRVRCLACAGMIPYPVEGWNAGKPLLLRGYTGRRLHPIPGLAGDRSS